MHHVSGLRLPGGTAVDTTAQVKCASGLSTATCAQAIVPLDSCERLACAAPCGVATMDAGATLSGDTGGGETTFSCSSGSGAATECDQQDLSTSALDAALQGCAQVGGMPGSGCSDAGVAGCCRLTTTENCYYDDASATAQRATCMNAGGTWSTTP